MRRKFSSAWSKLLIASLIGVSVGTPIPIGAESREIGAGYNQSGFVTERDTAVEFSNVALQVKGFLKGNGDLMLSGDNSAGQLGTGDRSSQAGEVLALSEVQSFSIGSKYVIAIRKDGSLWGWGTSENGELLNAGTVVLTPTKICDGSFKMVSCGNSRVLALTTDGDLFEWGDGTTVMAFLGRGFVQVSAGANHYAAVKEDGGLWTWGNGANGELCNGGNTSKNTPTKVASGFEKVSCGDGFTIALDSKKNVWGAGKNSEGQLGSIGGSTFKKLTNGLFWDVAAGSSCSVLQSVTGRVTTWGTGTAANGMGVGHENYTIRFLGGESSVGEMEPVTAKFGRTLILPKCGFSKEGYSFKGWATEEGGSPVYADGASVTDLLTSQVFQDEILYAVWEPNRIVLATDYSGDVSFSYGKASSSIKVPNKTVTVTLDSNGGSSVSSMQVPLVFQGYVDKNGTEIFNRDGKYVGDCTKSCELTAVWKAQETELPVPTRVGYVFGGWATSNTATSGARTFTGTEDTSLIATWVENGKVVYNFSQNGGIQASSSVVTVANGDDVPLDVTATKVGWELIGWNTDPNATTALEGVKKGSEGLVLYAIYSKTVTISFKDGEQEATYEVVYYNNETEREIELQKLSDYTKGTPLGWCKDGNTKEFLTGTAVVGLESFDFYAAYSNDITVNFRSGADGSYQRQEAGQVISVSGGESVLPAEITFPADVESVDDYEFKGWCKDGTGELIAGGTTAEFTEGAEYYAWYEKVVTLTYDTVGGPQLVPVSGIVSVTKGEYRYPTVDLTVPVQAGFDFKQWTIDGQVAEGTITLQRNCTAVASWDSHEYTVSFDGSGATMGVMNSFKTKCGEEFTLPATGFGKAYTVTLDAAGGTGIVATVPVTFVFKGWSTTPGGEVQYLDRESVSDLTTEEGGRVVLYAVWQAKEVVLPTPRKAGFVFSGWLENNGKVPTNYTTEKNITLTASWVDAKYAVTINMGIGSDQVVEGKYGELLPTIQPQEKKFTITLNYSGLKESEKVEAAYVFKGVFDQKNGRGTMYYGEDFAPCKKWDKEGTNITLYGYWLPASVELPKVEVEGHTIGGWYLNGKQVTSPFQPTKDCELVLKEATSVYGLTYNVKGGTLLSMMNSYSFGTMVELPRAWKKGFMFRGWKLPNGTVVTSLSGTETGDLTLTAVWERSTKTLENLENKESVYTYSIPEGVTAIPEGFFKDCKNLATVSIPEGVETIGAEAFSGCESLTTVVLPSTVTKVGDGAFAGSALISATVNGGYFDAAWFFDCAEITTITITDPNCVFASTELDPMITLCGYSKSTAKEYAEKHDIDFQVIGISYVMTTDFGFGNTETSYIAEGAPLTLSKDVITWLSNKDISFNGYVLNTTTTVAEKGTKLWNALGNLVWMYGYNFGQDVSVKALWNNGGTNGSTTTETTSKVASFVKNKIAYKVHGNKVSVANASKKSVTVPATVKWEGKTYKVAGIENAAFRGDMTLKSITLGKNVKRVGKNAFRDCKGLITVRVKASNIKVGKDALKGTNAVKVKGTAKVKKAFSQKSVF